MSAVKENNDKTLSGFSLFTKLTVHTYLSLVSDVSKVSKRGGLLIPSIFIKLAGISSLIPKNDKMNRRSDFAASSPSIEMAPLLSSVVREDSVDDSLFFSAVFVKIISKK